MQPKTVILKKIFLSFLSFFLCFVRQFKSEWNCLSPCLACGLFWKRNAKCFLNKFSREKTAASNDEWLPHQDKYSTYSYMAYSGTCVILTGHSSKLCLFRTKCQTHFLTPQITQTCTCVWSEKLHNSKDFVSQSIWIKWRPLHFSSCPFFFRSPRVHRYEPNKSRPGLGKHQKQNMHLRSKKTFLSMTQIHARSGKNKMSAVPAKTFPRCRSLVQPNGYVLRFVFVRNHLCFSAFNCSYIFVPSIFHNTVKYCNKGTDQRRSRVALLNAWDTWSRHHVIKTRESFDWQLVEQVWGGREYDDTDNNTTAEGLQKGLSA